MTKQKKSKNFRKSGNKIFDGIRRRVKEEATKTQRADCES